jgi:hypothetical protein
MVTKAFILRLTWDSAAHKWLILLKPVDGGKAQIFGDVETAFLHVAGFCTERHAHPSCPQNYPLRGETSGLSGVQQQSHACMIDFQAQSHSSMGDIQASEGDDS